MPEAPKKKSTDDIVAPGKAPTPPGVRNRLPRRDITIALSATRKKAEAEESSADSTPPKQPPKAIGTRPPFVAEDEAPRRSAMAFAGAMVLLALILGGAAWFTRGVSVEVTPRERVAVYDGTFTAYPSGTELANNMSPLFYEEVPIAKRAEELVPATESKQVSERAAGTIVIFNNYSSASQRLVTNTRFETPDGLIYRINKPVVVPGLRSEGGETVPGSIEVQVFADEPGDRYNIGLTDFTIPGFKGGDRYDKFFARSKTPMEGGFVGERLMPDEAAVAAARERLRLQLEGDLAAAIDTERPGHSLYLGSGSTTFESLPLSDAEGGVLVTERGTMPALYVDESAFAAKVAAVALQDYDGFPVSFIDPSAFTIKISQAEPEEVAEGDEVRPAPLVIMLAGEVGFVWYFDAKTLAEDLAGQRSADMQSIMHEKHPGIENAEAAFLPFCLRCTFPKDGTEIEIINVSSSEQSG